MMLTLNTWYSIG